MSTFDALRLAKERELDLVEVGPTAQPPIAKIMDYGKYRYEAAQKAKESRRKSTNVVVKEMKYRPKIGHGDFDTKTKKVEKFLGDGAFYTTRRALRMVNPSPYMFLLELNGFSLVGASPEIHVRCEDRVVEIRPIAGTRKRGASPAEDAALETDLLADPKERAEHVMLVDLARNDLGRVCDFGSVKVKDLMIIERYSHVMHIVSQVQGTLSMGHTVYDLMRATFPAGTLSGAPKIRAMQIIAELEQTARGPYGGCVGYFSFNGNLDCCITIRTALIQKGKAYVQAGGGWVHDSTPEGEYNETVNKAKAMLKALAMAEGFSKTA